MNPSAKDASVSPALIIKNGRVHAVGSRPVHRRRVVVMAVSLTLATLASVMLPMGLAQSKVNPQAEPTVAVEVNTQDVGWSNGWGVDWAHMERAFRQRGFSPAQTLLASALLDRLAGVRLMGAAPDDSMAAGLAQRDRLAQDLQASLVSPSDLLKFAEQLNATVDAGQANAAARIDGFDAVGYLAAVGWNEDDSLRLKGLQEMAATGQDLSWEDVRQIWAEERAGLGQLSASESEQQMTWDQARLALQEAVDTTGLAQLQVSASLISSPSDAMALATHLVNLQKDMAERLGLTGPVLGLGGRVKLDLALPAEMGTHGQVVAGKHGVTMRTALHAIPHEHFHAMSALMSAEHPQGEAVMEGVMGQLKQGVSPEDRLVLAKQAREQFVQHMDQLGLAPTTQKALLKAQDKDGQWESLYLTLTQQEGLYDQDARMVLMMAMALSTDYEMKNGGLPRWAGLRQAVGHYLQGSGELESSLLGQYTGSREETLAAAYAAQFPAKWSAIPGLSLGILDAPGPREAELQAVTWQHFAQEAAHVWSVTPVDAKDWRANRQPVATVEVRSLGLRSSR